MKIAIVAAGAGIIAAFTVPDAPTASTRLLKDRAAMLIYAGRDSVIARVPFADSANFALIVLKQQQGEPVARSQLANRPCVGVALFSKAEWAELMARGRTPADVRPSEASMRLRVYPAAKNAPAVVDDIQEGTAYVAFGLEYLKHPPPPKTHADSVWASFRWSVQTYVDSARGACTAE